MPNLPSRSRLSVLSVIILHSIDVAFVGVSLVRRVSRSQRNFPRFSSTRHNLPPPSIHISHVLINLCPLLFCTSSEQHTGRRRTIRLLDPFPTKQPTNARERNERDTRTRSRRERHTAGMRSVGRVNVQERCMRAVRIALRRRVAMRRWFGRGQLPGESKDGRR